MGKRCTAGRRGRRRPAGTDRRYRGPGAGARHIAARRDRRARCDRRPWRDRRGESAERGPAPRQRTGAAQEVRRRAPATGRAAKGAGPRSRPGRSPRRGHPTAAAHAARGAPSRPPTSGAALSRAAGRKLDAEPRREPGSDPCLDPALPSAACPAGASRVRPLTPAVGWTIYPPHVPTTRPTPRSGGGAGPGGPRALSLRPTPRPRAWTRCRPADRRPSRPGCAP
jgi:hypothetical protein